jgi:hypothetical protein
MGEKPLVEVEPDERWQQMVGSHADIVAHAASWPVQPTTNAQVAEMLAICRRLFEHMYFVYEFGVVAVVWSPLAVEAALRDRLGEDADRKDGLTGLIGKTIRVDVEPVSTNVLVKWPRNIDGQTAGIRGFRFSLHRNVMVWWNLQDRASVMAALSDLE